MPPTRSKKSSFLPPKLHRWLSEPGNQSMSPTSAAKASKAGIALRAIPASDRPSKMQPPSRCEPTQGAASPSTPSHTTPLRVATHRAIGVHRPSCLYLDQWPSQRGIASSVDVVCYPREDSIISEERHFYDEPLAETPKDATWHLRVKIEIDSSRSLETLKVPAETVREKRPLEGGVGEGEGEYVSFRTVEGFEVKVDLSRGKNKVVGVRKRMEGVMSTGSKKVKVEE